MNIDPGCVECAKYNYFPPYGLGEYSDDGRYTFQCGLCDKMGETSFESTTGWLSTDRSSHVHIRCLRKIPQLLKHLFSEINKDASTASALFPSENKIFHTLRDHAQLAAISALREKIGEVSILDYANSNTMNFDSLVNGTARRAAQGYLDAFRGDQQFHLEI
ncbi:hypothetical protein SCG7086_BM_00060 [Chlamydiales bacterium SCGC AG-110-P3]|nr:hypothetical protein SCG7086_BM_00060 [Chlamydiales bacterium SCGC AG-110-P3]